MHKWLNVYHNIFEFWSSPKYGMLALPRPTTSIAGSAPGKIVWVSNNSGGGANSSSIIAYMDGIIITNGAQRDLF